MKSRSIQRAFIFTVIAIALCGQIRLARADDAVDQLLRGGRVPADKIHDHGHSDFYADPVGRFLDLLAAGAFTDARSLQPDACRTWLATRQNTAWTGKFRMWGTELDLNILCAPG